ncbi:MAG: lipase maturation factor family protein, partial [Anaerolineales bacterium]|nr:lipase maturation factor family protein [Anaerolineales bacterium]
FSWLNHITIILALASFSDGVLGSLIPLTVPELAARPIGFDILIGAAVVLTVILSYFPVRNLISPRQFMNYSFNPFHLVNTYGAFGSITKRRLEVIVEGTDAVQITADTEWKQYGFVAKPGDVSRMPPQVAPYHLRLDWMMWFLPFSPHRLPAWFSNFMRGLLNDNQAMLALIADNPFEGDPPNFVRARFFRYRFSEPEEKRSTGQWWQREFVGKYLPPISAEANY